jgi:endonuclease/exonuclease/phosphatase family metal-dependent hydrolase
LLVVLLACIPAGSTPQRGEFRVARSGVTPPKLRAVPDVLRAVTPALPTARGSFRALTFNAGLAVGVLPYARERAPKVGAVLASFPVDLMCLQEVWLEEHWSELQRGARQRFDHAYRPRPAANGHERCSKREMEPAIDCVRRHCSEGSGDEIGRCAEQHCSNVAENLSPGCTRCLLRDPTRPLDQIRRDCSVPPQKAGEAPEGGKPLAYGGSYGIGILSSVPAEQRDFLPFDRPHGVARGVIYVSISAPGLTGTFHVFCTHLTPVTSSPPHPLSGQAEPGEQARQIELLLRFIERKAPRGATVMLLGDLNSGPGSANVLPALPQHYQRFVRAGFESPYLSLAPARCTFCANNPVHGGQGGGGSILDHALLRDFRGRGHAARALDEPIEIEVEGRRLATSYSDHYGVVLTVEPPDS